LGSVKELGEGKVEVANDFELLSFDFVSNPSTQGAFLHPVNESKMRQVVGNKYGRINEIITDILVEIGK
jgi:hypothetical protein